MPACGWEITGCGCGVDCWDRYRPEVQERAAALAVNLMWAATGRRYGPCEVTVQPCNPRPREPLYQVYPVIWDWVGTAVLDGGRWYNRCRRTCCDDWCSVALAGPTTTDGVVSVAVAGDVIPPAAYVIMNRYLLVRVDGECWPTCTSARRQSPPDFEVTYLRGLPVPPAVQAAVNTLACEYAKACTGADCRLPTNLSRLSRQGVEVTMAETPEYGDMIRTGIPEVDAVIAADNPGRRTSPPLILSPDTPPARVVS